MVDQFDDQLLDEFAHTFYGYGNYQGRYWFIGMEEGGGNSFAEVNNRLTTWSNRGKQELEDVYDYHAAIGIHHLFGDRPKLQSTWKQLNRIVLSSTEKTPTVKDLRDYQSTKLGRSGGDTCLLELLPLPSPSTRQWLYAQRSTLPYLVDREKYREALRASRIAHLRQRINEHQGKDIIFYGLTYRKHWMDIAGVDFLERPDGISVGRRDSNLFLIIKHPAARRVTNEYFHSVGRLISNQGETP